MEPLRGVEPRKPSVRRTTGRRPERHGCRARTRTSIRGFRGRCPAIRRPGIEYERRESDPHRGEVWARRLCLWVMPACAARDSNPVRRSKSPEHSHTCSRHVKRMPCPPGLDERTRTYGFPAPEAGVLPLGYTQSRGDGRNRTRYGGACRARPLPLAVIPMRRQDGACRLMLTLLRCHVAGTFTPQGGARTGGRSRTFSTGFGDRRRNRPLHPYVSVTK
jgi:hypothetical protein